MEVKYHINPETGVVGTCKAVTKCPFGSMTRHFNSSSQARASYERQMQIKAEQELLRLKTEKAISIGYKPSNRVSKFLNIQIRDDDEPYSERLRKTDTKVIETAANRLVESMSDSDGVFVPPEYDSQDCFDESIKFLGSGAEVNAYLDLKNSIVLKIPNTNSSYSSWNNDESKYFVSKVESESKTYESLDKEKLSELGIEYVPTYFVKAESPNGITVPVVVQPYLDDKNYMDYNMSKVDEELVKRVSNLDDFETNTKVSRKTGRIILFDCLDTGDF